ncbi:SusC/RagA family TonB-linked outer membrane protein [Ekhidna sp.]
MKRILLLAGMFFFAISYLMAQKTVSGKVTDDAGEGLPGVNVVIKGTTTGVTTDLDGNFRLSVEDGATLVFSYIGFTTQEIAVGSRTTVDVTMSGVTELQEVVVTALGITKEKASLGYSVASVGSQDLVNRQETDVARLLRGQAPGVDITQTSGLAGSGTNVIIRGYSSISGSNQPLFVVDGVPFNTSANSGNQSFGTGSATASSRFLDLDPNNIADVSILKGLSATVLYGEAGRNGVVLVTTKTGKGGSDLSKKTEVSITQSVFQTEIANLPDYQDSYGNGFGAFGFGWFFSNWGPRFDDTRESSYGDNFRGIGENGQVQIVHPLDQSQYNDDVPQFIGQDYDYRPYRSVENFFQKGVSSNTSISISSRVDENTSVSLAYSFLTEEGFTPKLDEQRGGGRSNFLDKHNFSVGMQTKLKNGLKIQPSFNFVRTERLTPITAPSFGGDGNGLFAAVLFTPRSVDLINLPYQSPIDGSNIYYRRGSPIQNPLWTLNNSGQTENVNRFFGNINLGYDLSDNFSVLYRLSLDSYDQKNSRYINKGGPRQPGGEYTTATETNFLSDQILNLVYNFDLNSDFSIDGVLGFNSRRETNNLAVASSQEQFVYDLFTHQNFTQFQNFSRFIEENTLGVYFTSTIGYSKFLYLNLQARNDWTSTLESANRSVFYPSASLSFLASDAIDAIAQTNMINFLKLRLGYGTSAGYPDPYRTRNSLAANAIAFTNSNGTTVGTNSVRNFLANPDLTNELITELEFGLEGRFFNNILGVDLSLYNKQSSDLIVDLPLDPSTGYTSTTINAADIENRGIELGLDVNVPLPGELKWNVRSNYTRNVSEINSILEGIDRVQIDATAFNQAGIDFVGNYAIPGEQFGVFYGEQLLKDEDGNLIVDSEGSYQLGSEFGVIGDPNPDFQMNFFNTLSWKGFTLGFQFQYVKGGDVFSSTAAALLARGNSVDSDIDRNIPVILPGVKEDGTENDIQVYVGDEAFNSFFNGEGFVFDGTVIRLRQVSLNYVVPKSILSKTPFGNASITISGENLWYNAPNTPEGLNFDPEISSTGVGNARGFDFRTAPTAKKYGVTLNLTL